MLFKTISQTLNSKKIVYWTMAWVQKYFQTDAMYLAKGGFWLILSQIGSIILSLLLAIAFANLLPKEIYGQYQYVLAITGYLMFFTLPKLSSGAIVRAVAQGNEGSFFPAMKTRIRWGMLGGIASLGLAGYYFFNNNLVFAASFLMIAFFIPIMEPFSMFRDYLKGKQLFQPLTKVYLTIQLISTAFLILALFQTDNLLLILLVYFTFETFLNLIFSKLTLKKFPPNKKEDPKTISYGKHLSVMGILESLAYRLDLVLLWYFWGAEAVAVYSFACVFPQRIIGFIGGPIHPLVFPKLSQRNSEELRRNIPKKAFRLFLLLIPMALVYIFLVPFLFKMFFPQYLDAVLYSQIFALSILLIPEGFFSLSLMSQMKIKHMYVNQLVSPLIQIALLIILTPLYGIMGTISALLIAGVSRIGLLMFLFKRM